jgi:hypothetical protein
LHTEFTQTWFGRQQVPPQRTLLGEHFVTQLPLMHSSFEAQQLVPHCVRPAGQVNEGPHELKRLVGSTHCSSGPQQKQPHDLVLVGHGGAQQALELPLSGRGMQVVPTIQAPFPQQNWELGKQPANPQSVSPG